MVCVEQPALVLPRHQSRLEAGMHRKDQGWASPCEADFVAEAHFLSDEV